MKVRQAPADLDGYVQHLRKVVAWTMPQVECACLLHSSWQSKALHTHVSLTAATPGSQFRTFDRGSSFLSGAKISASRLVSQSSITKQTLTSAAAACQIATANQHSACAALRRVLATKGHAGRVLTWADQTRPPRASPRTGAGSSLAHPPLGAECRLLSPASSRMDRTSRSSRASLHDMCKSGQPPFNLTSCSGSSTKPRNSTLTATRRPWKSPSCTTPNAPLPSTSGRSSTVLSSASPITAPAAQPLGAGEAGPLPSPAALQVASSTDRSEGR
jgi:hypothetical protein